VIPAPSPVTGAGKSLTAIDCSDVMPVSVHARRMVPFIAVAILVVLAFLLAISCKGSTVLFRNGDSVSTLNIEVVNTDQARVKGLMGRESLAPDSGMLFDFGLDVETTFWMKDTRIPLSIAFISSDGTILAIKDMKPFDLTAVSPPGEYRYAIEVNQGWFASHGIKPGSSALIDL